MGDTFLAHQHFGVVCRALKITIQTFPLVKTPWSFQPPATILRTQPPKKRKRLKSNLKAGHKQLKTICLTGFPSGPDMAVSRLAISDAFGVLEDLIAATGLEASSCKSKETLKCDNQ